MRLRCLTVVTFATALLAATCASDQSTDNASVEWAAVAPSEGNPPVTEIDESDDDPAHDDEPDTIDEASSGRFAPIAPIIEAFIDEQGLNGAGIAIVQRDHGITYEEYWGEFDPDRVSLIASSSKMISAGVLLRLHDDGALDLDAPIGDVADWGIGNPDVTPAQLISSSSGLVGLWPDPGYAPYLCQFDVVTTLQDCGASIFTTEDDDVDVVPPDTQFRYGGAQWQVAGALAEAASGRSWAELVDEIYIQPCELQTLGFGNLGQFIGGGGLGYPLAFDDNPEIFVETANPYIEAGVFISVPDYAALLLMHLRDGACGDNTVISPESLARAHGDRIGEVYGGDSTNADWGYGMGWWFDRVNGRITDDGLFGSSAWLDLDDGYGVFLVIEATWAQGQALNSQLYDIIESAVVG